MKQTQNNELKPHFRIMAVQHQPCRQCKTKMIHSRHIKNADRNWIQEQQIEV